LDITVVFVMNMWGKYNYAVLILQAK